MLCVGLDTEWSRLPVHLQSQSNGQAVFNKAIIQSTSSSTVAYKINTAFYESRGIPGWEAMAESLSDIPETCLKIADAKRGDIGNTSRQYAIAFFEQMHFDAITVSPYMGIDSVKPFLEFQDKWVIILGLTSNQGSQDFQQLQLNNSLKLYEQVINTACTWGSADQIMFVVGATNAHHLANIRSLVPDHFLLIPGVGAQGGDLSSVIRHGANADGGLLINASRDIIFQSSGEDYAEQAGHKAKAYQEAMVLSLG